MGSTTLKQALAEGQFKDQNGKNKLKKMELDLYPSKINSKAFKNQFYHFEDYHPSSKDLDSNNRLLNSETRKNYSGPVNTEPGAKEAPAISHNVLSNNSTFGFNLSGFNKMINATGNEKQAQEVKTVNRLNSSPTGQAISKKGKSFVEKRPSIQGLLGGRQQVLPESTVHVKSSGKQTSGTGAVVTKTDGNAQGEHYTNSGKTVGGHIEFQQKRNSYSFNRKEQPRISPQNDGKMIGRKSKAGGGPGYGAAASVSPVTNNRVGLGQQPHHQKSMQEESSQGTSIGQRLMSYFGNK